jgi:tripartite motif-containing protein 71
MPHQRKFSFAAIFPMTLLVAGLTACAKDGDTAPPPSFTVTFLMAIGLDDIGAGEFREPTDLSVDSSGDLYVVSTPNNKVLKIGSDGTFITSWGSEGWSPGQFRGPSNITNVGKNVVVTERRGWRIQEFTQTGTWLTTWANEDYGAARGECDMRSPAGIDTDSNGNYYVASTVTEEVCVFSPLHEYMSKFGTSGVANGQFKGLRGLSVTNRQTIMVAERDNFRVQEFGLDGVWIRTLGSGIQGKALGEFSKVYDVDTDEAGRIYIVDGGNARVQVLQSDGTPLVEIKEAPVEPRSVDAIAIAIHNSIIYILDYGNSRILAYRLT